jgi:hypothetical protein
MAPPSRDKYGANSYSFNVFIWFGLGVILPAGYVWMLPLLSEAELFPLLKGYGEDTDHHMPTKHQVRLGRLSPQLATSTHTHTHTHPLTCPRPRNLRVGRLPPSPPPPPPASQWCPPSSHSPATGLARTRRQISYYISTPAGTGARWLAALNTACPCDCLPSLPASPAGCLSG